VGQALEEAGPRRDNTAAVPKISLFPPPIPDVNRDIRGVAGYVSTFHFPTFSFLSLSDLLDKTCSFIFGAGGKGVKQARTKRTSEVKNKAQ
jgi:hypothetical protein